MIPMFVDDQPPAGYAITAVGESQASENQNQVMQHEVSNSFILQICLHPTAQKVRKISV